MAGRGVLREERAGYMKARERKPAPRGERRTGSGRTGVVGRDRCRWALQADEHLGFLLQGHGAGRAGTAWSALLGVTRSVWLLCEGCLGGGKHLCGETSEDVCDRITGKRVVGYMDKSYGSKGKKKKGWAGHPEDMQNNLDKWRMQTHISICCISPNSTKIFETTVL